MADRWISAEAAARMPTVGSARGVDGLAPRVDEALWGGDLAPEAGEAAEAAVDHQTHCDFTRRFESYRRRQY